MNSLGHSFIALYLVLFGSVAIAEWTKVSNDLSNESGHYIDQDSVKQAGPMAIYRQVKVLSQDPLVLNQGIRSKLSIYEYDCMNTKFRLLEAFGFSAAWAKGEKIELQPTESNSRQWQDLPIHALGQVTFNMLCPSGKDD